MRHFALLALYSTLALTFICICAPGEAQQSANEFQHFVVTGSKARAPAGPAFASKPYQAVAVKLPAADDDASFETFRQELAAVAKTRVYGELARLVTMKGFFWDRDFNGGFDGRQPAVDNLAAAIRLEHRNGMGWGTLAIFAAEATASPFTSRPGIICAPAVPSYDGVEFDHLIDETRSHARDWVTPRTEKTAVHAAARSNATVIETLGPALVRLLGYLAKDNEPDTIRAAWVRIATPAGKIGFAAPRALMPLSAERLCYGKDGFGRWRIAGFVGAD